MKIEEMQMVVKEMFDILCDLPTCPLQDYVTCTDCDYFEKSLANIAKVINGDRDWIENEF